MAVSDREFGQLLGKVSAIEADLKRVEKNVEVMDSKVDGIIARFDQIDGGLKVSMWFAGIIGALGMFALTKFAPLMIGILPKI